MLNHAHCWCNFALPMIAVGLMLTLAFGVGMALKNLWLHLTKRG